VPSGGIPRHSRLCQGALDSHAWTGRRCGRLRPERRRLTVFAEACDGFAPFGQFTSREVRYYGVGLQFDFSRCGSSAGLPEARRPAI